MGEGLSHWSSMVLRKSQTYFFDRHTHPNSMYSNFCHVLNYVIKVIMLPFGYDINNIETVFIYLFSCLVTYAISFVLGEIISRNAWLIKLLTGGR